MAGAAAADDEHVLEPDTTVIVEGSDERSPVTTRRFETSAELLQQYLRRAAGVDEGFEIVGEDDYTPGSEDFVLAVGATQWLGYDAVEDLWRHGYVIRSTPDAIGILGPTDLGTFYGAVRFLDEFVGVRFYMPGDLWTSMPDQQTLTVPAQIDIESEPFATMSNYTSNWGHGLRWAERNAVRTVGGIMQGGHNIHRVLDPERFAERYPEIYPLVDGTRFPDEPGVPHRSWNPCFSTESTLIAAEEYIREFLDENPDYEVISLGLQDSHVMCECDDCEDLRAGYEEEFRKMLVRYDGSPPLPATNGPDPALDRASRYANAQMQWRLADRLAQRIEDVLGDGRSLMAYAYGVTPFPPNFDLHPNVIQLAQIHVHHNIAGLMKPYEDGTLPLDRFILPDRPYGHHEWHGGSQILAPRVYTDHWSKYLRYLSDAGVEQFYMHAETYHNLGFDGPKYWILAQLQWDPHRDHLELWRQLTDDMFGPASCLMFDYFRQLEAWFVEQSMEKRRWVIYHSHHPFESREPEDMLGLVQARETLEAALELAETDEQRERIGVFERSSRLTAMLFGLAVFETTADRVDEVRSYFNQLIEEEPEYYWSWRGDRGRERFEALLDRLRR